jgi:hypothetical protein
VLAVVVDSGTSPAACAVDDVALSQPDPNSSDVSTPLLAVVDRAASPAARVIEGAHDVVVDTAALSPTSGGIPVGSLSLESNLALMILSSSSTGVTVVVSGVHSTSSS